MNRQNWIKLIVTTEEGHEYQLVAQLAEYATGEQMDSASVTCISKNEIGEHIIRTYAMKRMDGNVFVITLEYSPDNWSIQSGIVTPSSNNNNWGNADKFF